jgi:catechol 2,3-dioxygenase-like lactoylglutathione lyase family enzyme
MQIRSNRQSVKPVYGKSDRQRAPLFLVRLAHSLSSLVPYGRTLNAVILWCMKRTWTIIGVRDIARSFEWYPSLFGQPLTRPAHDDFGQLCDSDGTVLLCLHQWGAHEHPPLMSPEHAKPGNGLLLFFRVDDFSMALKRARALVTRLEEEPRVNPNTGTMEFALRDPDGYYVMISAPSARESSE